jgi:DNA-binding NtrC family response regulator
MKAPANKPVPTSPKKDAVLLVDDEQPLLDIYEATLSRHFDVVTAKDVAEADEKIAKRHFKVVIADHRMPGESGMDFLVRMRREFPAMQRVLITGFLNPELVARGVREAALFRYLLKPVLMSELVKLVRDAAGEHDARIATLSR